MQRMALGTGSKLSTNGRDIERMGCIGKGGKSTKS